MSNLLSVLKIRVRVVVRVIVRVRVRTNLPGVVYGVGYNGPYPPSRPTPGIWCGVTVDQVWLNEVEALYKVKPWRVWVIYGLA